MQIDELLHLVPALTGDTVVITRLDGGITNRNVRVDVDGEQFVVRIGEPAEHLGIDRVVEYDCSMAAARCGVGPEVIAFLPEHRMLVTRFITGTILTPENAKQPDTLSRVVAALRRYHDSPSGAGQFSPFATIRTYHQRAGERGVIFPDGMAEALRRMDRIEALLPPDEAPCPCHNDLLPANFLDDGTGIWIIDWEYAGMGNRFFDLGNLAANHRFTEEHERLLLNLYFGQVREEDLRRLKLVRLLSDLRECLWGFLQSSISALDFDFRDYAEEHLQRFLTHSMSLPS